MMRKFLLAAAVLVRAFGHSPAYADEKWYYAQWGSESCVPISEVDATENTPEDVIQKMRAVGALVGKPEHSNGIITYRVTLLNQSKSMVFLPDGICRLADRNNR
jgi:hypothetical protein